MKIYYKMMSGWHFLQKRHYEILIKDCLLPSMRKQQKIKAEYHKEMSRKYTEKLVSTPVNNF